MSITRSHMVIRRLADKVSSHINKYIFDFTDLYKNKRYKNIIDNDNNIFNMILLFESQSIVCILKYCNIDSTCYLFHECILYKFGVDITTDIEVILSYDYTNFSAYSEYPDTLSEFENLLNSNGPGIPKFMVFDYDKYKFVEPSWKGREKCY